MLIVGAKGFAKEVLEVLYQSNNSENIVFFDNINEDTPDLLYQKFKVLKNFDEAKSYFNTTDRRFTIGIGNPVLRKTLKETFIGLGGVLTSTISPKAEIGHFGNEFREGCNVMTGTILTNDIKLGECCLVNLNCTIGHDCIIGDYVELSPNVNISGNCSIGNYTVLGTNAIVLPNIVIGENVIVAAGAVVTKNVPDNTLVAGVPAVIKKHLDPLSI